MPAPDAAWDTNWDDSWDGEPPSAGGARLVLAEDGARVLRAEPGASGLVRALAPEGALPPAIARQIRRGVEAGRGPRMLRLRLDPRGIAPPTLCRAVQGRAADGSGLILLAVIGTLPALRAAPAPVRVPDAAPAASPDEDPNPSPPSAVPSPTASEPDAPRPGDRFLWRSDAADALTQVSGGGDALAGLVGASWADLAGSGRLDEAAAFLDALAQRRTFRGLGAVLALDDGLAVAADLSGAPLGRPGQAFQGYGGFGIVRAVGKREADGAAAAPQTPVAGAAATAVREDAVGHRDAAGAAETEDLAEVVSKPALEPAEPASVPREPDALAASYPLAPPFGPGLGADTVAMATMAAPLLAAWLRQDWFGPPARISDPVPAQGLVQGPVQEPVQGPVQEPAAVQAPVPAAANPAATLDPAPMIADRPEDGPEPDPVAEEAEPPASALSMSEHDAFREIARALGVRYAGDAVDAASEGAPADPAERGAVMPFSFAAPTARPEPEPAALLDGVPGPLLLLRGPEILAANRAFLDLAGYPDLAALRAAGLARLFPAPLPDPLPEGATRALQTRNGTVRTVALAQGAMPWPGGPAACLLLRPLAEATSDGPALAPATRPALPLPGREAEPGADADTLGAALDAVAEGVVVADAAGRVLALNRAAADLLGRDPRAARGAALGDLLPGADEGPDGAIAIDGRRLALHSAALGAGRRALLLRPEPPPPEGPGFVARFLAQLDREIRTPLTGILGFVDVMLKEPYGPLGHARYRSYLSDVRASGEQVLGLVADLVDLATVETGGLPMSRRPLPLNDLVAACVAEMQAEAARGRIVLRTSFAEDLAPLEADEPSLARAARLVIGNAIRLTGAGGQVIVSTNPAERGGVALRVRDTGTGMSPEEIAFALEPFRGRPEAGGLDGTQAGAGLGLPLSRALVEANDGRLSISSRKDEGTLVEILLPGRAARYG
ncbi:sensor histidine kinase [Methylobacterium radiodurans]|uniref:sensor histidine kinase n=1 Tax=Methylobacterium radiodurans TaxID=2202828 RepID=UPI0013A52F20|nr:ATP-binding protein [Methylobacterium radiodurans]